MADRVRMKSKTVMNNPLIVVASSTRADKQTVIEGDEFSTTDEHAQQLEALGYAERIDGTADDMTEAQTKLAGSQTSGNDAIAGNRKPTAQTKSVGDAGSVGASTKVAAPVAPAA